MPYITIPVKPKEIQISFDDILNGIAQSMFDKQSNLRNTHDTKTVYRTAFPQDFLDRIDVESLIGSLKSFIKKHEFFYDGELNLESQYYTFLLGKRGKGFHGLFKQIYAAQRKTYPPENFGAKISEIINRVVKNHPCIEHSTLLEKCTTECADYVSMYYEITAEDIKKMLSDNFRRIDAPNSEFKAVLNELKSLLETKMFASYHTSAFAYVKGRCTIDAVKRHQSNKSRWFLKLDFKNFFGNSTPEFLFKQVELSFPFSEIVKSVAGKDALHKVLSICFLHGGLPQGTPISPTLTNIMMIPIDHAIAKFSREYAPHLCYTRYADDLLISSEYNFKWSEVQENLIKILNNFNAPFTLNVSKTRYGSSAGRNWNLGVMLNKDNQITIGHQRKKEFKATIFSFIKDFQNGKRWDLRELQILQGEISYYASVEKEAIADIINTYNKKHNIDVLQTIASQIKSAY